jgi:hypothetical protein
MILASSFLENYWSCSYDFLYLNVPMLIIVLYLRSFSWMTASNNWWIELMLEKESSWRTWYWVRDSQNLFGWGWKCRHLIYLSGLKHWVSRYASLFCLGLKSLVQLHGSNSCYILFVSLNQQTSQQAWSSELSWWMRYGMLLEILGQILIGMWNVQCLVVSTQHQRCICWQTILQVCSSQ